MSDAQMHDTPTRTLFEQLDAMLSTTTAGAVEDDDDDDDSWTRDTPKLITDLSLRASSMDVLKADIVDIDDPAIADYKDFELYLRALAGASGGSIEFLEKVVIPWAKGDKRNTPDMLRSKWRSHKTSHVGYGHVRKVAEKARAAPSIVLTAFSNSAAALVLPRAHLYGKHHTRGFLSSTVAPGGVGKSTHGMVEAIAMAAGRPLLVVQPVAPLRVLYWNAEDPQDENLRKARAACLHHGVTDEELGGRLFLHSGRDHELVLAQANREGAQINKAAFARLEQATFAIRAIRPACNLDWRRSTLTRRVCTRTNT
jgi:AAA domain